MVENNDVEEDNNIYHLGKVIKAIGFFCFFFKKKIKVHQWWKVVILKKTTMANFWRIVITAFVVIYSYIWGYNQKIIGIIPVII